MMEKNDIRAIENIKTIIKDIKENNFTLYFYVIDGKGNPNGTLAYIYQLAKTAQDIGYNVKMVYNLPDEYTKNEIRRRQKANKTLDQSRIFVGVEEWLGKEYSTLEHLNIGINQWTVAPGDIVFIPEALAGVMQLTHKHKITSERIIILTNYENVTEFMPVGTTWLTYGIDKAISSTQEQADLVKNMFPHTSIKVLPPKISDCFRKPLKPQKLIVNLVCKRQNDVNKIIKPFFCKYPIYKFITFRDLRGFPRERFAEMLQEGAITVWVDPNTSFGYSAVEALRCGNILIGKVPDVIPQWMKEVDEEGHLRLNNCVWTYDINSIPDILANTIASWMQDEIPQEVYTAMEDVNRLYGAEEWEQNVKSYLQEVINNRVNMFESFIQSINAKEEATNE